MATATPTRKPITPRQMNDIQTLARAAEAAADAREAMRRLTADGYLLPGNTPVVQASREFGAACRQYAETLGNRMTFDN